MVLKHTTNGWLVTNTASLAHAARAKGSVSDFNNSISMLAMPELDRPDQIALTLSR